MVDFWFNYFNIFVGKGYLISFWVGIYERDVIWFYVFGNFCNLLGVIVYYLVMLFYLDNWLNIVFGSKGVCGKFKGLNENYVCEFMEFYSMGINGGYI